MGPTITDTNCLKQTSFLLITVSLNFRFPPKIIQTRCLCEHCLMYDNEIDSRLLSRNITVTMKVIMFKQSINSINECDEKTCDLVDIDVPVGCHCAICR